ENIDASSPPQRSLEPSSTQFQDISYDIKSQADEVQIPSFRSIARQRRDGDPAGFCLGSDAGLDEGHGMGALLDARIGTGGRDLAEGARHALLRELRIDVGKGLAQALRMAARPAAGGENAPGQLRVAAADQAHRLALQRELE